MIWKPNRCMTLVRVMHERENGVFCSAVSCFDVSATFTAGQEVR